MGGQMGRAGKWLLGRDVLESSGMCKGTQSRRRSQDIAEQQLLISQQEVHKVKSHEPRMQSSGDEVRVLRRIPS